MSDSRNVAMKRLPALGRSLGGGIREFTDSIRGKSRDELPPGDGDGDGDGDTQP